MKLPAKKSCIQNFLFAFAFLKSRFFSNMKEQCIIKRRRLKVKRLLIVSFSYTVFIQTSRYTHGIAGYGFIQTPTFISIYTLQ